MDPGGSSAPPSISSGGFRSVEPQFSPTYNSVEYPTQAPSMSSMGFGSTSVPTDGQRTVAGETHVQAPSYTHFQHGTGSSINGFTHRGFDATDYGGQAPDLDAVVRENKSATVFNDYSDYEKAPSYSGVAPRDPSIPGVSAATPMTFNAGYSIVGRNFPRGNLMMEPYN